MKGKNLLVASAAALLLMSGAIAARADESAGANQVGCFGVNSCKGHGACATAHYACKGQNSCKGMGVVLSTEQECKAQNGTVVGVPHPKQ